jgi:hypothetical protein
MRPGIKEANSFPMVTERRLIMETTFISKENGKGRWPQPTHPSQGHHR